MASITEVNESLPTVAFPAVVVGDIGGIEIQTVNGRDLHAFLEVGKDFSTWIKDRIAQYGFADGADYAVYQDLRSPKSGSTKSRTVTVTEYAISIDMAKELAMVERNDQGKRVRQYFIQCERRAKQAPAIDLNNPADLRMLLASYANDKIELQAQVADLTPKAEALDRIATADGSLCITDTAKALQMRPKDLFSYLQSHGWIYRRPNSAGYLGYQSKTNIGLLEHKMTTVLRADGSEKITEQVRITPKGLTKLSALMQPFSLAA